MVAAWRCDRDDRFPSGQRAAHDLLGALREGPPWPALTTVMPPADRPAGDPQELEPITSLATAHTLDQPIGPSRS